MQGVVVMIGYIVLINIIRIFFSAILWALMGINTDNSINVFFFPYTKTYKDAREMGYSKTGSMILTILFMYLTFYVFLYELIVAFFVGAVRAFDFVFKEKKSDS